MNRSKRDKIVEAADLLFYQKGYEFTSFADIASSVSISRGNFYYHFKTKDDILTAVINRRLDMTDDMLNGWDIKSQNPTERIMSFVHILISNKSKIERYGCPVGTLTTELSKLRHPALEDATRLFSLFKTWLMQQFVALGFEEQSEPMAMHILGRSQGVATLLNAFKDDDFLQNEIRQMQDWLEDQIEKIQ